MDLFGGIMSEIKSHPYTSVAALISLAGIMAFLPHHLEAQDTAARFDKIEAAIETSQLVTTKTSLETRMKVLERDIFDLEVKIREYSKTGEPDIFLTRQLDIWKKDHDNLRTELSAFLVAHPDIVDDR